MQSAIPNGTASVDARAAQKLADDHRRAYEAEAARDKQQQITRDNNTGTALIAAPAARTSSDAYKPRFTGGGNPFVINLDEFAQLPVETPGDISPSWVHNNTRFAMMVAQDKLFDEEMQRRAPQLKEAHRRINEAQAARDKQKKDALHGTALRSASQREYEIIVAQEDAAVIAEDKMVRAAQQQKQVGSEPTLSRWIAGDTPQLVTTETIVPLLSRQEQIDMVKEMMSDRIPVRAHPELTEGRIPAPPILRMRDGVRFLERDPFLGVDWVLMSIKTEMPRGDIIPVRFTVEPQSPARTGAGPDVAATEDNGTQLDRVETEADRLLAMAVADEKRYGNNPYRIHNLKDMANCAVFLDHLSNNTRIGGFHELTKKESRYDYWRSIAASCGSITRFYWNSTNGFAIVTMQSHEEAVKLFSAVGDRAWDVSYDYDGCISSRDVAVPFARWCRPKNSHEAIHRKRGSHPAWHHM